MPDIFTVMLLTYNRLEYAKITINSFLCNIDTKVAIHFHIADDGSPDGYVEELEKYIGENVKYLTTSVTKHEGYGANYNAGTQGAHGYSNYVFVLEDDWQLTRSFPIDRYLDLLEKSSVINSVRFGYVGYTQQLRGEFYIENNERFLLLDPHSPERHVFAGHPRLETVKYQRAVGEWPLGVDPGTTEFIVAGRDAARRGIVWPVDFVAPSGNLFVHIGTIQAREDQK